MIEIAIVADDLTGAADTAAAFSPALPANRLIEHGGLSGVDFSSELKLLSVYTNSRGLVPPATYKRLFKVFTEFRRMEIGWIYKKIDSSLRGNLGAEIDAAVDALDLDFSVVAPAYPSLGRTTKNGVHLIHGIPVGESEVACDPMSPVKLSGLSEIVASQSRYPVEHIPVQYMSDSGIIAAEMDHLIKKGVRHLTFDAVNEDHLDMLVDAVLSRSGKNVLLVGSAGLAESLAARILPSVPVEHQPTPDIGRPRLLVCGSASIRGRQQTDRLVNTGSYRIVELEDEFLIKIKSPPPSDILLETLAKSIHRSVSGLVVRIAQPRNEGRSSNMAGQAEKVMHGLGFYIAQMLPLVKPSCLFLSGGDTASEVMMVTGCNALCVKRAVMSGIIETEMVGGNLHALPVYTKAGAFGQVDDLVRLDNYWNKTIRIN